MAGSIRAALGGAPASVRPEEDVEYATTLLGSAWAPDPPERVTIGGQEFVVGPVDLDGPDVSPDRDLLVYKWRSMVDRYRELADAARCSRVVELGVAWGGSTALLFQLFQPDCLVAFDLVDHPRPALDRFIDERGVRDRVHVHLGIDQSDHTRVLAVVRDAVDGAPLDLVVDDASHSYVPTRSSFGALFPLLREGGLFVIEDWQWAHAPGDRWQQDGGYLPNEPALTNLLVEIMMLQGTRPDIVRELRVRKSLVEVVRGEAAVDSPMDVAALTMNRGNPFRPFL